MKRALACVAFALLPLGQSARAQSVGQQLLDNLERYRTAVLEYDVEREVASFTENAELALGSEPVVQGRTTIRALLVAPSSPKVITFVLRAAATRVEGSTAVQNGVYSQRIVTAQHQSMLEKGTFEVHWARQSDGSWLISSLHTDPIDITSS